MTITELDVFDPEVAEFSAWVICEDCGDSGPALDMARDSWSGAWLCWTCHNGYVRESDDQERYLTRLYFGM